MYILVWAKQFLTFKMNTMELDTLQNFNVTLLQSHWVLISEAGVWASRWHQMTSRPAATLPCQNISWLAFPAFLALFSKTLHNTLHLTLQPPPPLFWASPANVRPFTTSVPDKPQRPSLTPLKCHFHILSSCHLAAVCTLVFYLNFYPICLTLTFTLNAMFELNVSLSWWKTLLCRTLGKDNWDVTAHFSHVLWKIKKTGSSSYMMHQFSFSLAHVPSVYIYF